MHCQCDKKEKQCCKVTLYNECKKHKKIKPIPCEDIPCEKKLKCFNDTFPSSSGVLYSYSVVDGQVTNPKVPPVESYFDATVISPNYPLINDNNPIGLYSCWCLDAFDTIQTGTIYNGKLVSLLDPHAIEIFNTYYTCNPGNPLVIANFASIVFILNKVQYYQDVKGYTKNDIQVAMWTILFSDDPFNTIISGGLSYTLTNVLEILVETYGATAEYDVTGDACKYLILNNIMGLIMLIETEEGCVQICCIMVDMCEICLVCYGNYGTVCNCDKKHVRKSERMSLFSNNQISTIVNFSTGEIDGKTENIKFINDEFVAPSNGKIQNFTARCDVKLLGDEQVTYSMNLHIYSEFKGKLLHNIMLKFDDDTKLKNNEYITLSKTLPVSFNVNAGDKIKISIKTENGKPGDDSKISFCSSLLYIINK